MAKASAVTLMLQNELSLMHSGSIRLRTIGIHCRIRAREAAGCLRGAGLIAVMDDSSRLLGLLTEGDLLSGMVALGGEAQMTQILRFTRSENNLPVSLRSTS